MEWRVQALAGILYCVIRYKTCVKQGVQTGTCKQVQVMVGLTCEGLSLCNIKTLMRWSYVDHLSRHSLYPNSNPSTFEN